MDLVKYRALVELETSHTSRVSPTPLPARHGETLMQLPPQEVKTKMMENRFEGSIVYGYGDNNKIEDQAVGMLNIFCNLWVLYYETDYGDEFVAPLGNKYFPLPITWERLLSECEETTNGEGMTKGIELIQEYYKKGHRWTLDNMQTYVDGRWIV